MAMTLGGTMLVAVPTTAAVAATSETFVSDLTPVSQVNGWGPAKVDKSLDGNPLTLAGKTYSKGWGTNATSSLEFAVSKQYTTFSSDVGIDDEVGANGNAQFVVYGDNKELWRSTEMTGDSATQAVNVDIRDVTTLKLVVNDLGNIAFDHANWADAKLLGPVNPIVGFFSTKDGSKKPFESSTSVRFGTSEADALATLPTEGFSLFRDGNYFAFRATWAFDAPYDGSVPGVKSATATITSISAGGAVAASTTGRVDVLSQSALPAPWSDRGIGDSTSGKATYADGAFSVAGSGSDIWGRNSGFHYAFQRYSGDVQITARLRDITDTNEWAKAGVMISDGLESNAKFVSLIVTPRRVLGLERRTTVGGETDYVQGTSTVPQIPTYLRLNRAGDRFTAWTSSDGSSWSEAGSVEIPMQSGAYVGLAVTSHDTRRVNTSTFDNVTVGAASTDKSKLQTAVDLAARALSQAEVGTAVGNTDSADVDRLNGALAAGRDALDEEGAQQRDINAATDEVAAALDTFQTETVQSASRPFISSDDLNESGTTTVGDLGIASGLAITTGPDGRIADTNNDGKTDATDLRAVAEDIANKRTTAFTPPMGWNSWDVYANTVNEAQLRAHADYTATHLKKYGWQYIVNDIQWYNPQANGSYDMRAPSMDQYGRLIPAVNRFPSSANGAGFLPLSDYVHSKGLKFGIHIMRGVPRAAVDARLPIKGTSYTVDQIANRGSFAWWNGDMWGIDASKPGAKEYVDSIVQMYADWGVDFIKIDDLSAPTYHQAEVDLYRDAIDKTGREMVLSTSPGNTPISAGPHVKDHANMWRMSNDFWDNWPAMLEMYELTDQWTPFRGPGHWPDADMLPLGKLEIRTDPYTGEEREGRMTRFTRDEQVSLMTLWSMAKSPLILGNDLRVLEDDPWTKGLITNRAVLNINQASTGNKLLYRNGDQLAWTAKGQNGSTYLSHANLASSNAVMATTLEQLGLPASGRYLVYDLWSDSYLGVVTGDDSVISSVATHGARLLQLVDLGQPAGLTDSPITASPYTSEPAKNPSSDGPSLTLTGSGTRSAGSQVTITVSGERLGASTAQEVVVSYDATKLRFGSASGVNGSSVVNADSSKPGELKLLITTGAGVTGAALSTVTFTVTGTDPTVTASATVADKSGRETIANRAATVTWGEAPVAAKISATASTRCVSGKAVITVQATNQDTRTLDVSMTSTFGTKPATLEPGKTTAHAFTTRQASLPAGSVDVTASAPGGSGSTVKADYSARTCR